MVARVWSSCVFAAHALLTEEKEDSHQGNITVLAKRGKAKFNAGIRPTGNSAAMW